MRSWLTIAVFLAMLCGPGRFWAPGPALADEPGKGEVQGARFHAGSSARDIPFRYELGHIIVPVRVADSLVIDMILDTGLGVNGAVLLDPAIGRALGLRYSGQVSLGGGGAAEQNMANVATGVPLSLPGMTFPGQSLFVVVDPEPYRGYPGRGIIGKTLFDCPVEIDYERERIHLYDKDVYRPPEGSTAFEASFTYGIPVIDARLSTEGAVQTPVRLLVDTGAEQLLLFTWSDRDLASPGRLIAGRDRVLCKGFTGDVHGATGRIASLQLGPYLLQQVITSFPDSATWGSAHLLGHDGMLGNDALRRFLVAFDYAHQRIYLKPNARFEEPFEFDMTGMFWEPDSGGAAAVVDVIPGSPATDAGIETGDLILALDHRSMKEAGWAALDRFSRQEGATITMTILRDEERLEKTIRTRRLI